MGTSHSVGEFSAKIRAGGKAIQYGTTAGVNESALQGKAIIESALPFRSMRNVGAGAKLGAYFKPARASQSPTAWLGASGPVQMAVGNIRKHAIYPRGVRVRDTEGAISRTLQGRRLSRGRRGGTTQALAFNGIVRSYVNHPGVPRPPTEVWWAAMRLLVARNHARAVAFGTHRALTKVF